MVNRATTTIEGTEYGCHDAAQLPPAPADAKNCLLALEMLALDHFHIYLAQVNLIKSKHLIGI